MGRLEDGIACFKRALESNWNSVNAHNNLGKAIQQQGHVAQAVACYRRAEALQPDFAERRATSATFLPRRVGPTKQSTAAGGHSRSGRTLPKRTITWRYALYRQGKFDEAAACYRRAVEAKPDYAVRTKA